MVHNGRPVLGAYKSAAGDEAFLGMMDSGTTVASLKVKLQETTGIKVGWQVLLLGAPPDQPKRKLFGFNGEKHVGVVCCWFGCSKKHMIICIIIYVHPHLYDFKGSI